MLRKIVQWVFVSSSNPEQVSGSVKFALLGVIPVVIQALGLACGFQVLCIEATPSELEAVVAAMANVLYFGLSAVAAIGFVLSFGRKVYRTAAGTNKAMVAFDD